MLFLIHIIRFLVNAFSWLVIIQVLLSYFMSPYHPVREVIDRIVEPLLHPIRRVMPRTGMIDFSPMVLLILVQLVGYLLERVMFILL